MAKRITSSAVNWAFVTETLGKPDRASAISLKTQNEKYLRDISGKPAELPAINWSFYKSRIQNTGMVDSYQKSYEALKIPFPSAQAQLDAVESKNKEWMQFAQKKYDELIKEIENQKKHLAELEKVMRYSDMTLEEFYMARPDLKIDPDKPKFWPQHYPFEEHESKEKSKEH